MNRDNSRVNNKLAFKGPEYEDDDAFYISVPFLSPSDFPTADTFRVRVDSTEYTCDNEGT